MLAALRRAAAEDPNVNLRVLAADAAAVLSMQARAPAGKNGTK